MASASRALLLYRASPLHAAASRFLCPLAAAGASGSVGPAPAARRFTTQLANSPPGPVPPVMAQCSSEHGATTPASDVGRQRPTRDGWFIGHNVAALDTTALPRAGTTSK
ncbi:hypothetical protein ZWY2020_025830 [Hordeum vulgare]|nr:hypothetical protein ZWY2020_025830 [Hordeum vulgare]